MEKLCMKAIGLMTNGKDMENIFMRIIIFMWVNLKIISVMEKEKNITLMEILSLKEIGLSIGQKDMANIFMKMVNIILVNLKMV